MGVKGLLATTLTKLNEPELFTKVGRALESLPAGTSPEAMMAALKNQDPALHTKLRAAFKTHMDEAAKAGTSAAAARREFIGEMPESMRGTFEAQEQTLAALAPKPRVDLAQAQASRPAAPAPTPAAQQPARASDTISAEERAAARADAREVAARTQKAESTIRSSLMDMHNVRTTNGKMPKEAFFSEFMDALAHKGLLKKTIQIETNNGTQLRNLTRPKDIFGVLESGGAVTERELRTLGQYFAKFHNDSKLATSTSPSAPVSYMPTTNPVVSTIDAIARNFRIETGRRTSPTLVQTHTWENGFDGSLTLRNNPIVNPVRNVASAIQERPVRSLGATVSAAALTYAIGTTVGTINDPQHPSIIAREVIGAPFKGQIAEIHDYIEYLATRYSNNPQMANNDLKKYYGIEFEIGPDGKFPDSVIDALQKGPLSKEVEADPTVASDIVPALTLFVAKRNGLGIAYDVTTLNKALADLKEQEARKAEQARAQLDKSAQENRERGDYRAAAEYHGTQDPTSANRLTLEQVTAQFNRYADDDVYPELKGKGSLLVNAFKKAQDNPEAFEEELKAQQIPADTIKPLREFAYGR